MLTLTARVVSPKEILNTLGVFPISPKVLNNVAESLLAIPHGIGLEE